MTWKTSMTAAAAVMALAIASPAAAETINLAGTYASGGVPSFYTANFDFVLPTNFTDASLTITQLYADDRGVVRLNGGDIFAAGLLGFLHTGSFDFNDGNGAVPYYFEDVGVQNVVVASGFVAGSNSLRLLINDTGNGIFGVLANGPNGPSGTTGYNFAAHVDYRLREIDAVPEPESWALMILGFGAVGGMMRVRRRVCAA